MKNRFCNPPSNLPLILFISDFSRTMQVATYCFWQKIKNEEGIAIFAAFAECVIARKIGTILHSLHANEIFYLWRRLIM